MSCLCSFLRIARMLALCSTIACASRSTDVVSQNLESAHASNSSGATTTSNLPSDPPPTLILHRPNDAFISFAVRFHVGSQDDLPGKEGLAWLTAQLLAQGSTKTHSYTEILAALFPMAADYNVRVDREMITLTGRVHVDHGEAFQSLFANAYVEPAFTQSDFDRIRSESINYIEKTLRYGQDEELAKAALYEFMFESGSYRHPPQGSVRGLKSITLEDIQTFYQTHFNRNRARLAIAGNYNPQILSSFESSWNSLPPPLLDSPPIRSTIGNDQGTFQGQHLRLISRPDADASISIGAPLTVKRGEKDFYALSIANSWLGEHRNSKSHLFQLIRASRGLNYGDYSYIEAFPEGGRRSKPPLNVARHQQIFEIWIRTLPNESAHFAIRAAIREVDRLIENGLNQEQFEQTRNFLRKYVLHYAESTHDQLGYMIDDDFYHIDKSHLKIFQDMLDTITLQDVNQAIRRHLQTKNLKIAILTGQAEQLRTSLIANTPSPIKYSSPKSEAIMQEDEEIANYPLAILPQNTAIMDIELMFAS